jgi:hypothetical protein
MNPLTATPDPARCPLCGGPNGCAMAQPGCQDDAPQTDMLMQMREFSA